VKKYFAIGFVRKTQGKGWKARTARGDTCPEEGRKRQVHPSNASLHSTEACAKTAHNTDDLLGASMQKRLQAKAKTLLPYERKRSLL